MNFLSILFKILLTYAVYLQLRNEFYNSVTFTVKLLSCIATLYQYSCHFINLYYIVFDTCITTDWCLLSNKLPV